MSNDLINKTQHYIIAEWHETLGCYVTRIAYDFVNHAGFVDMAAGSSCDMAGTVKMFETIDPKVCLIETFAAGIRDTAYVRPRDAEWQVLRFDKGEFYGVVG